jgi:hypothetical protein
MADEIATLITQLGLSNELLLVGVIIAILLLVLL